MINFPVGTRVASYDFPGNNDCFIIGTVTDVRDDRYTIRIEKRIFDAMILTDDIGVDVHPPLNGQQCLFGLTNGVVLYTPI